MLKFTYLREVCRDHLMENKAGPLEISWDHFLFVKSRRRPWWSLGEEQRRWVLQVSGLV